MIYKSGYRNLRNVRHMRAGFTLVEIVIVIGIMAGIAAVFLGIVPRVWRTFNMNKAQTTLAQINSAVKTYQMHVGKWPATVKELIKGPRDEAAKKKWYQGGGPFLDEEPMDPWGNKYIYKPNPQGSKRPYELYSYGPNGPGSPKVEHISAWDK